MAKLLSSPYPGDFSFHPGEKVEDFFARTEALEATIPWERVMSFPVADGKACYLVVSEKPFVLQHIPIYDAYQISPAHIRGLRLSDWRQEQRRKEFWASLTDHSK